MSRTALAVAAALLLRPALFAQVPAVPAAPAAAAPAVPGAVPAAVPAAPAAPANIWSMICMTPEQRERCRQRICASPLAQLLGGMLTPARAFSGGMIPKMCPGPLDANPNDL